jgi:serine/threonine protein kinase
MSANGVDHGLLDGFSAQDISRTLHILDEYMKEMEEGNPCEAKQLAKSEPKLAGILSAYVEVLELMHEAAQEGLGTAPLEEEEDEGQPGDSDRSLLGDFLLLREIGRGGMGIVYEAEQLSLSRRVAVKVLPFAATLDAKQLHRFKSEARAAAHLHHGNIVPVYGVGCQRGVHYYAMQFIEGRTLAAWIADMRQQAGLPRAEHTNPPAASLKKSLSVSAPPAGETAVHNAGASSTLHSSSAPAYFQTVARLGLEAALALEHAHQLGVVHRDIKPANLLLDTSGKLWVTDFGLARSLPEQALTMTGELVGTLRYMSPEQAIAKRGLVDHRSDIYSLGVTLYEALTLEAAYPAGDREEVLRQIALNHPCLPRRLNRAIPVDLETIVLKAMAGEPDQRYSTAQELADDLTNFLEHRPIRATRPTLRERLTKWAWRHKSMVSMAAVILVLAVVGLAVSTVLIWDEKVQSSQALLRAEAESRRAKANFDKALNGTMRIMMRLEDRRWANAEPLFHDMHQDVVNEGLKLYHEFLSEDSTDPADRYEMARLYEQIASIHCFRKEFDQTHSFMNRAIQVFEELTIGDPDNLLYRKDLAQAHFSLGIQYFNHRQPLEAHRQFEKAAQQFRRATQQDKDGETLNRFAWLLATCPDRQVVQPTEAVDLAGQAVRRKPNEFRFQNTLGVALYRAGQLGPAIAALERSMELSDGGSAYDWFFLAMAEHRSGAQEQGRAWYDKGVAAMKNMRPEHFELVDFKAEAKEVLGIGQEMPVGQ